MTAKFIFSGAKDVTIGTDKYTFTVTANGTQLNASKNSATATKIAQLMLTVLLLTIRLTRMHKHC